MKSNRWVSLLTEPIVRWQYRSKALRRATRSHVLQAEILEVRVVPSTVNAVAESVAVAHNGMQWGNVLSNDTIPMTGRYDENMMPLPEPTLSYSYAGTNGSLTLDNDPTSGTFGSFMYAPNSNVINGTDSFSYTLTDPVTSDTSTTTVTITISDHSTITTQDDSMLVDIWQTDDVAIQVVTDADTDGDGDDVTIDSIATPSIGSAVPSSDGKSVIYTPPSDGITIDGCVFQVTLKDGHGNTAVQNVGIVAVGGVTGPGVWLLKRPMIVGGVPVQGVYHSYVCLIAPLGDTYTNFTRTIVISGNTYNYATLGGEPSLGPIGGKIISTLNLGNDNPVKDKVVWSASYNCASDEIGQIIGRHTNYVSRGSIGWVDYPPLGVASATAALDYNCNGYTHGLLSACGYSAMDDGTLIDWDTQIPEDKF